MESTQPPARAVPGTIHFIPPNLSAFEPAKPLLDSENTNTILWIGGLSDTVLSVTYPLDIVQALGPAWSLMTASLSSSGLSFGVNSIKSDVEDMVNIISYIQSRRPNGKIVIMGHSTGCQDCLHYLTGGDQAKRPKVAGIILQAPVSDRQALEMILPQALMAEADRTALEWVRKHHGEDVLQNRLTKPIFGKAAITAKRWLDLSSPAPDHLGADDLFSSDLSDERLTTTFGRLPAHVPLLILYSGSDEAVPAEVDKLALVQRWTNIVRKAGSIVDSDNSGVVPGATHNLNGCPTSVVQDLVKRVLSFIANNIEVKARDTASRTG